MARKARATKIKPVTIKGDLAYIPLTRGFTAIIDAADAPLVAGRNWHAQPSGETVYAMTNAEIDGRRVKIGLHRLIMGDQCGPHIDHENGDGLDCRRNNIRAATVAQNAANSKTRKHNSSGLKGASLDKRDGRWNARITVDGRLIHLGRFDTKEAAHAAYVDASRKHHGEFGRTR